MKQEALMEAVVMAQAAVFCAVVEQLPGAHETCAAEVADADHGHAHSSDHRPPAPPAEVGRRRRGSAARSQHLDIMNCIWMKEMEKTRKPYLAASSQRLRLARPGRKGTGRI